MQTEETEVPVEKSNVLSDMGHEEELYPRTFTIQQKIFLLVPVLVFALILYVAFGPLPTRNPGLIVRDFFSSLKLPRLSMPVPDATTLPFVGELPKVLPSTTPSSDEPSLATDEVVYVSDKEVYVKRSDGSTESVTQSSGSVFAFALKGTTVVTIEGTRQITTNNYVNVIPKTVHVYDRIQKTGKEIFSLTPISKENEEYILQLRSIGISSDEKKIAITSSDSLWIYDVATENLQQVFAKRTSSQDGGTVYAYFHPKFSPDGKQLLLSEGFYEGAGSLVVNLDTKEVRTLPYVIGNGGGDGVVDWFPNGDILVYSTNMDDADVLRRVGLTELNNKDEYHYSGDFRSFTLVGSTVYALKTTTAPFESIEVTEPGIEDVVAYDFDTKNEVSLFRRQRVQNRGISALSYQSSKLFFTEFTKPQYQDLLYHIYSLEKQDNTWQPIYIIPQGSLEMY